MVGYVRNLPVSLIEPVSLSAVVALHMDDGITRNHVKVGVQTPQVRLVPCHVTLAYIGVANEHARECNKQGGHVNL